MEWLETSTENCPVQLTLGVVGEKWSLLILRDACNGVRRFDDFRRHIGLSEAVLSDRLRKLTAAGILRATPYRQPGSRSRNEYRVTRKGWDLWPVLVALKQWGETHLGDESASVLDLRHERCGAPVSLVAQCGAGHIGLTPGEVVATPGPAARLRS
ncbi:winged helix-turn-helix transcriptional regulator [Streptomyces abyssomicinicus]|uniref:winged helix-turn-helix transcriptional regulator n=1 Tax=Streptomyces abyssomicinicus TaxID=574929 RepID=UPI00124FCFEC|nr:helix-turn-helix domain-containing protein [Streptomyces abyssomicinicus]